MENTNINYMEMLRTFEGMDRDQIIDWVKIRAAEELLAGTSYAVVEEGALKTTATKAVRKSANGTDDEEKKRRASEASKRSKAAKKQIEELEATGRKLTSTQVDAVKRFHKDEISEDELNGILENAGEYEASGV